MAIRYHLDENVNNAVAHGLRLRGVDVSTSNDAQLIGATDQQQLAYSLAQGRVIFTHDEDLLRLHSQGVPHAGIAFCHARRRTIGQIVLALINLWRTRSADESRGQVEFI